MPDRPANAATGGDVLSPEQTRERWARIRRLKKWLRPLPRKATMHRYPVLKWFAAAARQRSYLWSFRTEEAIPALYAGWILTMIPLLGLHIPLSLALAFSLRCNLPIIIGLVMLTNPLTAAPIYGSTFLLGAVALEMFGGTVNLDSFKEIYLGVREQHSLLVSRETFREVSEVMKAMVLGGVMVGYLCAFVSAFFYRRAAARYAPRGAPAKSPPPPPAPNAPTPA